MKPLVSVLIPTRERPRSLAAVIRMLRHLANDPKHVEVLVYADEDDPTDYNEAWFLSKARSDGEPIRGKVHRGARHGYRALHTYYNDLARMATGDWLFVLNDNSFVATKGWDDVLTSIPSGKPLVGLTETNHGHTSPICFPVFTRAYFEAVGHVAQNSHVDTWVEEVSHAAGIQVKVPIAVFRTMLDDGKVDGTATPETSADYYAQELKDARERDAEAVRRAVGA